VLETLEQVKGREPEPPRRLNPRVDRDLETVCLKCLQKEPEQRYGSAAELADDLDRWLAGEPVRARRAGHWERTAKWVRRRPALAALLAVTALSAVVLVAGLLWHNAQLREAAEREQRLAGRATRQRDAAWRAVNDMYTEVAQKWLAGEPGMSEVQREFLEKALRYYEDLAQEESEGPELLLERAKASGRAGAILAKLGRRPEAEAAYRHAASLLEGADVPGKIGALAGRYYELGFFLTESRDQNAEGQSLLRQALALWEGLPADEINRPEVRLRRANILNSLGMALYRSGRLADGEPLLQRCLPLIRGLATEFPKDYRYHHLLGGVLNNLAVLALELRNDAAEALRYLEDAITHQEEAVKLSPRSTEGRLFLRNHYATLATGPLTILKQFPEAVAAARKGLTTAERLAADFPNVPEYQMTLADAYWVLGRTLLRSGQSTEAEEVLGRALPILERQLGANPRRAAKRAMAIDVYCRLGGLRQSSGRSREAVRAWRRAVELDPKNAMANNNLAWLLALGAEPGLSDPAELVRLARTATEVKPRVGKHWIVLGLALYRSGDWAAAKDALGKASNLSRIDAPMHGFVLAMTEWRLGDKTAARTAYNRAIEQLGLLNKPLDTESRRLPAEAAQLLGVTGPATKPGGRKELK
jgi:tetratricopeptide (TPR) repeat protein